MDISFNHTKSQLSYPTECIYANEPGYCSLGDVTVGGYQYPTTNVIMVKAIKEGALVQPTSFTKVWDDAGSGAVMDGAVYTMNAPAGYTCLGGVSMRSLSDQPNENNYCCVKDEYTTPGQLIWTYSDKGTGSSEDLSLWTIVKDDDTLGLEEGNFLPANGFTIPSSTVSLLKNDGIKVRRLCFIFTC